MVMRAAAATLKPVSLELGGKSPNIVLADADMAGRGARRVQRAIFYNTGTVLHGGIAPAGARIGARPAGLGARGRARGS
jgi:hypothetical protein